MTPPRKRRAFGSLFVLVYPALVIAAAQLGLSFDGTGRATLFVPVAFNLVLLFGFARTLVPGSMPMVERFARMKEAELPPEGERYCRTVTIVWCAFFVANAAVTAALALVAPVTWWAAYTGFWAYVAMAALFSAEFVVRRARFRRYGTGVHERLLARVFPPR